MSDPRTEALAAYWRFFEGFNSRTAESWAAGLNFPHARISPNGPPQTVESAAVHARSMSWERVQASGWDHSVGAEPTVVHVGDDCVHVVGGWSRYTRDDRLIMTNHVGYVITRMTVDGRDHWGMQARFGVDPGPGGLTAMHADRAVIAVERLLDAWQTDEFAQAAEAVNLPFVRVEPGRIACIETTPELVEHLRAAALPTTQPRHVRSVQSGPKAVNVAVGQNEKGGFRAMALVTERAGRWGVQALSIIHPE